ncbi:hypothetical protein BOTNAR_0004g00350 [Botryotinia narcissicola]|uniref:Uncharacterized protein n=1 Tax=Botryotinia narcissicola TaxID=278944 RepID=A0A4Z1JEU3_9HELO|nr:hypothetical protein BOTNAR_0004g00350 [Botryotinia narcissicola]
MFRDSEEPDVVPRNGRMCGIRASIYKSGRGQVYVHKEKGSPSRRFNELRFVPLMNGIFKNSIQNPHQASRLGASLSTTKFFTTINVDSKIPTKVHLTLISVIFGTLLFTINNSKRTLPLKYREQILLPAEEWDKHIDKHSGEPIFTNISKLYDCQNKMLPDLDEEKYAKTRTMHETFVQDSEEVVARAEEFDSEEMWTTWEEERQELNMTELTACRGHATLKASALTSTIDDKLLQAVKRLGQSCEESYIEDNFQPAGSNHSETIAEDWRERAILSRFGAIQAKAKQDSADAETYSK